MSGPEITPSSADAQASPPSDLWRKLELLFGEELDRFRADDLSDEDDPLDEGAPLEDDPFDEPNETDASLATHAARLGGRIDDLGAARGCQCQNCGEHKLIIRRGTKKAHQPLILWCEGFEEARRADADKHQRELAKLLKRLEAFETKTGEQVDRVHAALRVEAADAAEARSVARLQMSSRGKLHRARVQQRMAVKELEGVGP
jgi:hypothetical protein